MKKTISDLPKLFETLLEGSMCTIVVKMDETVKVPKYLHEQAVVSFNLSWRFKAPMEIRDDGIAASLRFAGDWFDCWFPYDRIAGAIHVSTGDQWLLESKDVGGEPVHTVMLYKAGPTPTNSISKPNPPSHLRVVK